MKPIFHIASLLVKQFLRQPGNLVSMILIPLVFTFVIGYVNFSGDKTNWSIYVINHDEGKLGGYLIEALMAEDEISLIENSDNSPQLIIPSTFSETLHSMNDPVIQFNDNINSVSDKKLLADTIQLVLTRFSHLLQINSLLTEQTENFSSVTESNTKLFNDLEARVIEHNMPKVGVQDNRFHQSSPGMLVMFALFTFLASASMTIISDREERILARLIIMPIARTHIIVGKMLGIFVLGLIQILLLMLAGMFLFNVNWGQSPLAMTTVIFCFSFAATGMGIFIATIARSAVQANVFTNIIVMSMCALGGAWWPLQITPTWMQVLAHGLPVSWAMEALQDIIVYGLGFMEILKEAGILMGFAIVFFSLGMWRFKYE